ncbi:MAG: transglutaminase domain-containing protein [Sphingomonadaceae bacterium]
MIYTVNHVTNVKYDEPVRHARFNLRLQPVNWPGQSVSDFALTFDGAPATLTTRSAAYPALVTRVVIDGPIKSLIVKSSFRVTIDDAMLDMVPGELSIGQVALQARDLQDLGATAPAHFLYGSPLSPVSSEIGQWAGDLLSPEATALENGLALARRIREQFVYDPKATEADTPVETAFAMRRGVCQDFTHILIAALRWAGMPAAYASGYLRTRPPPGQPRLVGVDAMHAWAMLWCGPQRGWVGIDPTNGCLTGSDHIFVAMGRDYADVAPIDGIFIGAGTQRLTTAVDVVPINV